MEEPELLAPTTSNEDDPMLKTTLLPTTYKESKELEVIKKTNESDDDPMSSGQLIIDEDVKTPDASPKQENTFEDSKQNASKSKFNSVATEDSPIKSVKVLNKFKYLSPNRILRAYRNRAVSSHLARYTKIKRSFKSPTLSTKAEATPQSHSTECENQVFAIEAGSFSEDEDVDKASEIAQEKSADPLESPKQTLDNKLEKCGTTVTKIRKPTVSAKLVEDPVVTPETEETFSDQSKAKKIVFFPKYSTEHYKVLNRHPENPNTSYVKPSIPRTFPAVTVRKDLMKPSLLQTLPSSSQTLPSTSTKPQFAFVTPDTSSTGGNNKVRLQKSSNGTYMIVNSIGKVLPPESFPKAISYPASYEQRRKNLDLFVPKLLNPSKPPHFIQSEPSTSKAPTRKPLIEVKFPEINDSDDDDSSDEAAPPAKVLKTCPTSVQRAREKTPEPLPYIIPQDLLFSTTDRIKGEAKKQLPSETAVTLENFEDTDLFVIDDEPEEEKKPAETSVSSSIRNRRKAALVPKTDDDEMLFEEPPFQMPPRPQANVDLIENLAKYRVLVGHVLKKLKMPQIDFNEDGDEYINMYKIFKT